VPGVKRKGFKKLEGRIEKGGRKQKRRGSYREPGRETARKSIQGIKREANWGREAAKGQKFP